MLITKSRFLSCGEVWFDQKPGDARVDWILYLQRSRPVPATKYRSSRNLVIDLSHPAEKLLALMKKETASEIRRARERDQLTCEVCDPRDPAVMDHFEEVYNRFVARIGAPLLNRARLNGMAAAGLLDLTVAKSPAGQALIYHANYRDQQRVSGLYSASLHRELSDNAARRIISRANRYLTWSDLLRYQKLGLQFFDFGGLSDGSTPEKQNLDNYKMSFGGQVVRDYQCEQIVSLKGWLLIRGARLLKRARAFPVRLRPLAKRSSVVKVQADAKPGAE